MYPEAGDEMNSKLVTLLLMYGEGPGVRFQVETCDQALVEIEFVEQCSIDKACRLCDSALLLLCVQKG